MKWSLRLLLVTVLISLTSAESYRGAIAQLAMPSGWIHQLQPQSGVHFLMKPNEAVGSVFWLPDYGRETLMSAVVHEMGLTDVSVQEVSFAGFSGLEVSQQMQETQFSLKLLALSEGYAVLLLTSENDIEQHDADMGKLLRSIAIAPSSFPEDVVGTYRTASEFSDSYGESLGNASFTAYTTLWPNGTFTDESYTSVSQPAASAFSESASVGRWEVRDNTLYLQDASGYFSAFVVQSFSNGLELYSGDSDPLLWVRQ